MKLIHKDFRFVFEFKENTRSLLIVENPSVFLKLVRELAMVDSEEKSGFILSENETPIEQKGKLLCIVNPLSVTLNERRLLNRLGEILKKEIISSDLLVESNRIIAELEKYALRITQNMEWDLTYSDKIDVPNLLKFLGIEFNDTQETLVQKLIDYVKVMHEVVGIQCFVFVHLLSYLSDYEIEKFYEYIHYQKIRVLLLESSQPNNTNKFLETIIIDKDSCEIKLDM